MVIKLSLFFVLIHTCQTKKSTTTIVPGKWSSWGPWSECTKTCGIGVRKKFRNCSYTGRLKERRCQGSIGALQNCDTKVTCPLDGGWSTWEAWNCTVTCGGGVGEQKRSCTNPKPMFGGKDCDGQKEEKGKCNMQKCPKEIYTFSPMTAKEIKNSMDKDNNNFEKNEGETVQMLCPKTIVEKIYDEYPKASLRWLKNGKVLKIDHERMYITLTELTIKRLTSKDSGIYVCSVQYAPQAVKPITVAALSVVSSSPDIKVPAEQSMKLICHGAHLAKIFKNTTLSLFFNGQEYKDFGTVSPTKNSVYEMEDVKKNMSGKWTCKIKDATSNRQWTSNVVIVDVLPPIPKFLKFLSNKTVLLTTGIALFTLIMLFGSIFGYMIIKAREEFMNDFEKWCQILEWEVKKSGSAAVLISDEENESNISKDSETDIEI